MNIRLNKPMKSDRKGKKKMVFVRNPNTKRIKKIHFGAIGYSDYTKHKDKSRRKRFRARHHCETAKDKLTPRYWACKDLWGIR